VVVVQVIRVHVLVQHEREAEDVAVVAGPVQMEIPGMVSPLFDSQLHNKSPP
jgi:hypothetical protein